MDILGNVKTTGANMLFAYWTALVFWPSTHFVFFCHGATGQAATGEISPAGFAQLDSWN
jgi:hypothetical protein